MDQPALGPVTGQHGWSSIQQQRLITPNATILGTCSLCVFCIYLWKVKYFIPSNFIICFEPIKWDLNSPYMAHNSTPHTMISKSQMIHGWYFISLQE